MAVVYGLFASVLCWILAGLTRRGARRTESPLIIADAENWIVNAAVSTGVLVTFVANYFIGGTKLEFLSAYVDPVLVIAVVVLFIAVPIRMAWQALMELLNRAPPPEVVSEVRQAVEAGVAKLPVKELYVRVIQPGRTRWVLVHVVLPSDFLVEGLPALDRARETTLEQLNRGHPGAVLDMVFTADKRWGAPVSAGGQI
jgi:predicted Co/Zn/Cd cation transporter (cation efflux family)